MREATEGLFEALGDPIRYIFQSGHTGSVHGMMRENVQYLGEDGVIITRGIVVDLMVSEVGTVGIGDQLIDQYGKLYSVLYEVENDGQVVTVEVGEASA